MLTHDLHIFPLPISFEARSHCATHEKRKLSLRIFQINRELAFGRTLILLTYPLARAISQVWQFPLCRYRHGYPRPTRGHSARSNHRAPFFHHAGISSARSYVPISSGQWWKVVNPFQFFKDWKALDPTVMSRTTCCATTMISLCQISRSGTASSTCGDVYINFVKELL